jgi:hypothetical protein
MLSGAGLLIRLLNLVGGATKVGPTQIILFFDGQKLRHVRLTQIQLGIPSDKSIGQPAIQTEQQP